MKRTIVASLLGMAAITVGCTAIPQGLEPVTGFDPDRYLGKWYEIARLDHPFERGLSNVSATYTKSENGGIRVLNKGYNARTGTWKQIEGRARSVKDKNVGSLKVSFFGPFYGGYHILALDKQNYSYSMVAGPSRSYLWILSRSKMLDAGIYAELLSKAREWGFDTDKLILVEHNTADNQEPLVRDPLETNTVKSLKPIRPCPQTPNCVSSVDTDRRHFVRPLQFEGSAADARHRLLRILEGRARVRVIAVEDDFIQTEFVSYLFRFVDDVEFYLDDRSKVIHLRSASRIGFSDLGANRRRVEKIRKQFEDDPGEGG